MGNVVVNNFQQLFSTKLSILWKNLYVQNKKYYGLYFSVYCDVPYVAASSTSFDLYRLQCENIILLPTLLET